MLDPRRLVVLREVAAHESVSAAAAALGYTPSAVSQQLAALERETGTELVERAGRGIRLTEAALTLLPHAHAVLTALERAEAAVTQAAGDLAGCLRLASFPTATRVFLPAVLDEVRRRCPRLRVELKELEPRESLPALALGHIDVAVAYEYDLQARHPARDLDRADLLREPMLVASRGPVTERPARLADLAEHDWVLPPVGTACGDLVRRTCQAAGFEPRGTAETGDFSVMCALAAAGVGVALVPQLGVHPREGLALRPVAPSLHRRVFVAARTGSAELPRVQAAMDAFRAAGSTPATVPGDA